MTRTPGYQIDVAVGRYAKADETFHERLMRLGAAKDYAGCLAMLRAPAEGAALDGAKLRAVEHLAYSSIGRRVKINPRDILAILSASPAGPESLGVSQDEPVIQSSSTAQEPKSEKGEGR